MYICITAFGSRSICDRTSGGQSMFVLVSVASVYGGLLSLSL